MKRKVWLKELALCCGAALSFSLFNSQSALHCLWLNEEKTNQTAGGIEESKKVCFHQLRPSRHKRRLVSLLAERAIYFHNSRHSKAAERATQSTNSTNAPARRQVEHWVNGWLWELPLPKGTVQPKERQKVVFLGCCSIGVEIEFGGLFCLRRLGAGRTAPQREDKPKQSISTKQQFNSFSLCCLSLPFSRLKRKGVWLVEWGATAASFNKDNQTLFVRLAGRQ